MKNLFLKIICLMFLLAFSTTPAKAVPILTFGTGGAGAGGTIRVEGDNVIGTDIRLDELVVQGTATHDGSYDLKGPVSSAKDVDGAAALIFDTETGIFKVIGTVPALLGIFDPDRILLMGTITDFHFSAGLVIFNMKAVGSDTKDPDLLRILGINATNFTFLSFEIAGNKTAHGSPYTAYSTGVSNTPVPEPEILLFIGGSLLGLWGFRKRAIA